MKTPPVLPVRWALWALVGLFLAATGFWAHAQTPQKAAASRLHVYPEADLALGDKLVREHKCADCHIRNVGGDGSAIYRPKGRIKTPAALETMVEMCNTQLNLGLFPDDVRSVAAVLQRDHYRFAAQP